MLVGRPSPHESLTGEFDVDLNLLDCCSAVFPSSNSSDEASGLRCSAVKGNSGRLAGGPFNFLLLPLVGWMWLLC